MKTAGYSGKSLGEKLGVRTGVSVATIGAPAHYLALVGPLPDGALYTDDTAAADIAHLFVADRAELARWTAKITAELKPGATLWISWPKKSSPRFIDLTEGGVREAILPTGWVDVKVCAVDDDWSGLKFLRRRVQR